MKAVSILAVAAVLLPAASLAQSLAWHREGAAAWVCGGVGSDERRDLEALRANAKAEVLFVTTGRGAYIAGAHAVVYPASGAQPVLDIVADGPTCLLDLPPGSYRIDASYGDERKSARLTVPAKGAAKRSVIAFQGEPWNGIKATEEEKREAASPD
jgi:hypothetical protein